MEQLQILVTVALNNANEGEWLCNDDDAVEAQQLMDYDADVQQLCEDTGLGADHVAACVRAWKVAREQQ